MSYNPKYKVAIISKNSIKYDVTGAVTDLVRQEPDGEIAQRATFNLANVEVNGQLLSEIFDVMNRVFIYANDGTEDEVFRGFIWDFNDEQDKDKNIPVVAYDNLIFFQESEDYHYFSAGYSTKSICATLCGNWGVKLKYNYAYITHPKLPLRGNLADIFLTDLLEEVRKKTGYKSVMRSIKDVVHIDGVGSNTTVYKILGGTDGNAVKTSANKTMNGVVTKVVIIGKEDKNDRAQVEDVVSGNTSQYGTLQKVVSVSSGTTLAEVKEEAKETIKENGKPKKTYDVTSVDIPWIRKGDRVYVNAGCMNGYYIVKSITHNCSNKTMAMEAVDV